MVWSAVPCHQVCDAVPKSEDPTAISAIWIGFPKLGVAIQHAREAEQVDRRHLHPARDVDPGAVVDLESEDVVGDPRLGEASEVAIWVRGGGANSSHAHGLDERIVLQGDVFAEGKRDLDA